MIIKYKFSTGEVMEVEVTETIGIVILDSRRAEHANNERHRYHAAFSLDDKVYESAEIFDSGEDSSAELLEKEAKAEREALLAKLTPVQRRRFEMLEDGLTIAEIARRENASFNSVKESIEAARNRLKKFL